MVEFIQRLAGVWTIDDLNYEATWIEAGAYYTEDMMFSRPPPCSEVNRHVQILNIVEQYDINEID